MTKNPKYWGNVPGFGSMTFKAVTESGTRVAMLLAGDCEFIGYVPTEQVNLLRDKPDITVEISDATRVDYISLNTAKPPFDDVRVRHALNYAVDKDACVQVVYNGFAVPMNSVVNRILTFHAAQDRYEYNPEKAKQLLAEAGYPNGFTARLDSMNSTLDVKLVEFVQQQLAMVSVNVDIQSMERGNYYGIIAAIAKGTKGSDVDFTMRSTGWATSTLDIDWLFRPLFTEASFPPLNNVSYYTNPRVEELVKIGMTNPDQSVRAEAYKEAQEIVWKDAPCLFLCSFQNVFAYRNKDIAGIKLLGDSTVSVKNGHKP
jgi:glutathione transport system substrate-binding protein